MIYSFFRLFFILIVFSAAAVCVKAQADSSTGAEKEDIPNGIKETLAKNRIERAKKDYAELLERGAEAARLSNEIDKSFAETKKLSLDDRRKLERLEKLSKKIRAELGANDADSSGKDDDSDDVKLSSVSDAVDKLKNISAKLSDELKKTTRYSISAVAVQSSNAILKIVRFIRQDKD